MLWDSQAEEGGGESGYGISTRCPSGGRFLWRESKLFGGNAALVVCEMVEVTFGIESCKMLLAKGTAEMGG